MKKLATATLKRILKTIVYGIVGIILIVVPLGIYIMNQKPDLKVWHTAKLEEEFTADSPVETFEDYLALEDRLFAELDQMVYAEIEPEDEQRINRYFRGSASDPTSYEHDWNRSFELAVDPGEQEIKAGVLLIHGLTDSPYSLRRLGESLHARGAHIVGLRVPGHGTSPSCLVQTNWKDMAAAVRLAMRHLRERTGEAPLYVIGYSNGGALAVHYALSVLEDDALPPVEGMVLISPEIGITATAALAIWQERAGRIMGLEKLAWTGVSPEYDPFKYASFPVSAGNLAYELTGVNRSKLAKLSAAEKLDAFPPVLTFQSVVDATVLAPAVVHDLFEKLPNRGHELFVFGLNRFAQIEPMLNINPSEQMTDILDSEDRRFTVSALVNIDSESEEVLVRSWAPGESTPTEKETGLKWPSSVYSLSHVALPFAPDDPIYGNQQFAVGQRIHLGNLALRGEKGVFKIPAADMLRLRWNPFYELLEERVFERLGLEESGGDGR